jgi:hypothetical protein
MSSQANAEELLRKLKTDPTIETLEAARQLLRANRFTAVSTKLFRLADELRR